MSLLEKSLHVQGFNPIENFSATDLEAPIKYQISFAREPLLCCKRDLAMQGA